MDRVLQLMVSGVNHGGPEICITLNVGGLVISGTLVSNKKYWNESQPALRDMLNDGREKVDAKNEMGYIDLKDAGFFNAGENPVPASGMWWRGKIKSVDGFSLMRLAVIDEGAK